MPFLSLVVSDDLKELVNYICIGFW